MRYAGNTEAATKILVVLIVRNFAKIYLVAPAILKQRLVVESDCLPVVTELVVVRSILDKRTTETVAEQVAEFCADL